MWYGTFSNVHSSRPKKTLYAIGLAILLYLKVTASNYGPCEPKLVIHKVNGPKNRSFFIETQFF
jgi:hypothetical protein